MADKPPEPTDDESASLTSPAPAPEAREDWETRFKYLLADFENYRRRSAKERETATRQARAGMLRELLPLLEAFRAATEAVGHLPASDPVRQGLELLGREWATFLRHEGVEPVAVAGEPFRSDEAEAVGEVPSNDRVEDGAVAEVVQQGYRFYGGLLRPAKVIVARAKAPERTDGETPESDESPPEAPS